MKNSKKSFVTAGKKLKVSILNAVELTVCCVPSITSLTLHYVRYCHTSCILSLFLSGSGI